MKPPSLAAAAAIGAVAVSAALVCAPGPGATAAAAAPRSASAAAPQVRVNQVGYPPASAKAAFVMLPRAVRSVRFALEGPHGGIYLTGRSADDLGRWNARYGAVYRLSFSAFRHPGSYRIRIISPAGWL